MVHICVGMVVHSLVPLCDQIAIDPEIHDPTAMVGLLAEAPFDGVVPDRGVGRLQVHSEGLLPIGGCAIVIEQWLVVVRLRPIYGYALRRSCELHGPGVTFEKVGATPLIRVIPWRLARGVSSPTICTPLGFGMMPNTPPGVCVILAVAPIYADPLIASRRLNAI